MDYLFEVSWEVCNKVGGIYTLIRSKVPEAMNHFGDNYFLLGPQRDTNPEFKETDEPAWAPIKKAVEKKGLKCRFGRWNLPKSPRVILVDFRERYDTHKLLYKLWEDFGIDSYAAQWDYVEPVIFSTACAEIIEAVYSTIEPEKRNVLAHFHEWMSGAGLLYLKKNLPQAATIFTTHATILGRSMAGSGVDIYDGKITIQPNEDAKSHGILPKHSMESTCAREADSFTTVSDITAKECRLLLGKGPDHIVYNGLCIDEIQDYSHDRQGPEKTRASLLNFANRFLRKDLPPESRFLIISGRYEYRNKGVDIFIQSLVELEKKLKADASSPPVVAWIMMAGGHKGISGDLYNQIYGKEKTEVDAKAGISTHLLWNEHADPVIQACHQYGLVNGKDNKVNIIFCPAYLNGYDGIINIPYYDFLSACFKWSPERIPRPPE